MIQVGVIAAHVQLPDRGQHLPQPDQVDRTGIVLDRRGRAPAAEQIGRAGIESAGEAVQRVQTGTVPGPLLQLAHGGDVDAGRLGEVLLRKPTTSPQRTHTLTDVPFHRGHVRHATTDVGTWVGEAGELRPPVGRGRGRRSAGNGWDSCRAVG